MRLAIAIFTNFIKISSLEENYGDLNKFWNSKYNLKRTNVSCGLAFFD